LHPNVDLWADEVKGGVVGAGGCGHGENQENERKRRPTGGVGSFILGDCRETQGIILTDLPLDVELDGLQPQMEKNSRKTKRPRLG